MKLRLFLTLVFAAMFVTACASDMGAGVDTTPGPVVETVAPAVNGNDNGSAVGNTNSNLNSNANLNTNGSADLNGNANLNTNGSADLNGNSSLNANGNANTNGGAALPSTGGMTTTVPSSTLSVPGSLTPELPTGAVILFERSGGIIGQSRSWTVYSDGRVVDASGAQTQVDPALLATAMQTIRTAGFFSMQSQYGAGPAPDGYTYTLTVRDGDQVKTVTTFDGAVEAPAQLSALLQTIQTTLGIQ